MTLLSVATPAYNEAENLPLLYERLCRVLEPLDLDWEWVVVDDHSRDATFSVVEGLAKNDGRVRGIRLARNVGSHAATTCALHHARGDAAVIIAGDLQDPPEIVPSMIDKWRAGAQVVWAVRARREGESLSTLGFSRLYYFTMRRLVGIRELPPTGAEVFLIDRRVLDAFRRYPEGNVSIVALLTWLGFRQASISYTRQARRYGRSGWNLEKKLKLFVDSVTSFTYLPIRLMSYVGFVVALAGFGYAVTVTLRYFAGGTPEGWSSLMVVVLVLGGIQMLMMGVLGEYLWRALDEARRRPRYLVEATTDSNSRHD